MLLIKNGCIVTDEGVFKRDILVEGQRIKMIADKIDDQECEIIDASGKMVLPGFVDMHCHLRDPGYEYKEDIYTGTRSAAKGGFTIVACMPNTDPVIDSKAMIEYIKAKSRTDGVIDVLPIGAITRRLEGKRLTDMGELKEHGAVAVSDDGFSVSNSMIMQNALLYAKTFGLPVISHCEDTQLTSEGLINLGRDSTFFGMMGISKAAEEIMVARDVILAENTGASVHIAHVSTEGSVDIIRRAKQRGVHVTCETAPHYFSLDSSYARDFNTDAKVNPPLREKSDIDAIKKGLREGVIDVIATDHAPHSEDEKNIEFQLAKPGMVGFETAVPVALTELLHKNMLDWTDILNKFYCNPCKILNLKCDGISTQAVADIIIIDPEYRYEIKTEEFVSKSKNSPYQGYKAKGRILYTINKGRIIVRDGELDREVI
ncbi:MAG: dihydroorotase [Clostridia bacterium]|nr:dihydroorotase [Clostridia bacterium]